MRPASSRTKPMRPKRRGGSDASDEARSAQARVLGALLTLASLDAGSDARWEPADPLESALDRSTRHGISTRADVLAKVCEHCSVDQMTLRLRELGLNARGTKRALARRLLGADPTFAQSHLAGHANDGALIVDGNVVLAARPQTSQPSRGMFQCLRERDIEAAIDVSIEQHAVECSSSRGSVAWHEPTYRREMTQLLRRIFTSWPSALDEVPSDARGAYRVAAGMMALSESPCLPEWIDSKGPTRMRLTGLQTTTFVLRAAQHEMQRQRWRDAGITHARIVFAGATCAACSRLHDRVYNLRGLPQLPPHDCTCDGGYSGHLVAYLKARPSARLRTDFLS